MNFKEKYVFFHKTFHLPVLKSLYYALTLEVEVQHKEE